jgi:hypothetical protein
MDFAELKLDTSGTESSSLTTDNQVIYTEVLMNYVRVGKECLQSVLLFFVTGPTDECECNHKLRFFPVIVIYFTLPVQLPCITSIINITAKRTTNTKKAMIRLLWAECVRRRGNSSQAISIVRIQCSGAAKHVQMN